MADRFSKMTLALRLWGTIRYLQERHYFNKEDGWSQVDHDHLTTDTKAAYGEWKGAYTLMNVFCLWDLIPEDQFTRLGTFPKRKVRNGPK